MRFAPKTEEQLNEENLIPAGNYPFEVVIAEEKQSKAGNDMIALKLRVYHGERALCVNDWLMESMGFKLRHFCEETGLLDKYEAGTLRADDCDGKSGFVTLKVEPKKGDFAAKNAVKDYCKAKEEDKANAALASASTKDPDDDLPTF